MKQHKDLTYKYNTTHGRHGWLRLTPAYSVKLVRELLQNHQQQNNIFDPFSGNVIPVEQLYKDLLREHGFNDIKSHVIRKRNSKKSLYEYLVSAKAPS